MLPVSFDASLFWVRAEETFFLEQRRDGQVKNDIQYGIGFVDHGDDWQRHVSRCPVSCSKTILLQVRQAITTKSQIFVLVAG